jgi:hypothetical protein
MSSEDLEVTPYFALIHNMEYENRDQKRKIRETIRIKINKNNILETFILLILTGIVTPIYILLVKCL